jgi:hypothetical protein
VYLTPHQVRLFVAPVLLAAAIVGFLLGSHRGHAAPLAKALVAHQANIVLEYPSTWQPVASAAPIPGLSIVHPLLLAPGGHATRAGLLSGQLAAGEPGPLPASFVALMPELPQTQVVNFLGVQAYRYSHVRLPAYDQLLDLYVIPSSTGPSSAIACYASRASSSDLHECEQIVATLTPVGHSGYDLSPSASYSSQLGAVIGELDGERLVLRRQMGALKTPGPVAGLATTLAGRFATAAAAIRALRPPDAAAPAQASLLGALERAGESYGALAAAASSGAGGLTAAQAHVGSTEAGVDSALATFALLGYNHT